MLHRLAIEESETDTTGSQTPVSEVESPIDPNDRTPSMSSVFSEQQQPPRPSSPSSSTSSHHKRKSSFPLPFRTHSGGSSSEQERKKEDGLARWLRDGTVVFKSVGLGLMDLVVGMHLVKMAQKKNVGTQVEGF